MLEELAWEEMLDVACPHVLYAREDFACVHPLYLGNAFWHRPPIMPQLRGYDVVRRRLDSGLRCICFPVCVGRFCSVRACARLVLVSFMLWIAPRCQPVCRRRCAGMTKLNTAASGACKLDTCDASMHLTARLPCFPSL